MKYLLFLVLLASCFMLYDGCSLTKPEVECNWQLISQEKIDNVSCVTASNKDCITVKSYNGTHRSIYGQQRVYIASQASRQSQYVIVRTYRNTNYCSDVRYCQEFNVVLEFHLTTEEFHHATSNPISR